VFDPLVLVSTAAAPDTVEAAVALQLLAPTLQFKVPAAQLAGGAAVQVAEVAAPQVPLVQEKVAAPSVPVMSDRVAALPEAVVAAAASHVLPPTLQLKF
jgi:hypothetical protein